MTDERSVLERDHDEVMACLLAWIEHGKPSAWASVLIAMSRWSGDPLADLKARLNDRLNVPQTMQ